MTGRRTAGERVEEYVVSAALGPSPVWTGQGDPIEPDSLPLSPRLIDALRDWNDFHRAATDGNGVVAMSSDVEEEFVSQGFRLAGRVRQELPGRRIIYRHPASGQLFLMRKRGQSPEPV